MISYALGRRLPTDHVSGQLQFRFEITSNIHPGLLFFIYEAVYYAEMLFRNRFLTFTDKLP